MKRAGNALHPARLRWISVHAVDAGYTAVHAGDRNSAKLAARLDPQNGRESTLQKILAAREPACSGNGCHKGEGGVV